MANLHSNKFNLCLVDSHSSFVPCACRFIYLFLSTLFMADCQQMAPCFRKFNWQLFVTHTHELHNVLEYTELYMQGVDLGNKCATNAGKWHKSNIVLPTFNYFPCVGRCHNQCGLIQANPNNSTMYLKKKAINFCRIMNSYIIIIL